MTTPPTVEQSWSRVETWLARHAPVTHGLLRPPALPEDIATAERRLGVTFPADLRESLLRHNGVQLDDGALTFSYYGPLSGIGEIVESTEFLRKCAEEVDESEEEADVLARGLDIEAYRDELACWPAGRLLITLGIGWQSSDGLFLTARQGPNYGRLGYWFDEDAPYFTEWSRLREFLADFATALETGTPFDKQMPRVVEGRLEWHRDDTATGP
ncbi:SMI1/KNR4 family protein [Streptomyces sp. 8L]|uniref:SMI1/KNR4 family protein n=1 Tax=Streptomyces sp. 8L TaxID=2877242 RepID=UPI001CD635D3|nr:SMI1/KNR4 family protein [Streptomyces sp. 8L]MCA1218036.1 SMI1/KNR4 family protein [Streptomyces sp. 8L]